MKTIKQLSIFLENKSGRLCQLLNLLKEESIEIQAVSVADTTDYGILRLITSNQKRAADLLTSKGVLVNLNEVLAIEIDAETTTFASTIEIIASKGVDINYLYTFHKDGKLVLIIRPLDILYAEKVIDESGLKLIQGWE